MNGQFTVTTFSLKKRSRALKACKRCKKLHKKCILDKINDEICVLCSSGGYECIWKETDEDDSEPQREPTPDAMAEKNKKRKLSRTSASSSNKKTSENSNYNSDEEQERKSINIFNNDRIYANAMNNGMKSQFVISTQPLAPLFSRDAFLCLDGDFFGLYYPWKDFGNVSRDNYDSDFKQDKDLIEYLFKKNAFYLPSLQERKKFIALFLENVYPLYPVVDRSVFDSDDDIEKLPLILINAIMLSAIRYDDNSDEKESIRMRADYFRSKCKYLELIETNKVILIQSFLLLSSDEEGPQGSAVAREYSTKASVLCEELGLHNFAAKNQFEMINNDILNDNKDTPSSSNSRVPFELSYKKTLLSRLFWTSFCADRMVAVTSSSAMLYNSLDLLVEEPSLQDFEEGEYQLQDFEIFKRWYSISLLFERVIFNTFRPQHGRVRDDMLELDLMNWQKENLVECNPPPTIMSQKFRDFFTVASAYGSLLYLKSKINFIVLLTGDETNDSHDISHEVMASPTPLSDFKMKFFGIYTDQIMRVLKAPGKIEQILVIHSMVHILVLLQLEMEARIEVRNGGLDGDKDDLTNGSHNFNDKSSYLILGDKKQVYDDCLMLLDENRFKWWFSSAVFYLYREILDK